MNPQHDTTSTASTTSTTSTTSTINSNDSVDRVRSHRAGGPASFLRRHPVAVYAAIAFGIGWPALSVPLVTDLPGEPFLLLLSYVGLFGSALAVTRVAGGRGDVRRLLSRLTTWRFGVVRWLVVLFAAPALTVLVAAASGTFDLGTGGWSRAVVGTLLATVALALLINLWEETGWGGFVQTRLTARHGLLGGALLTAPLFAGIHLPMQFWGDPTGSEVLTSTAVLFAASPFYRYLLGMHLEDTKGSILAIAVQHASWNAAGSFAGVDGWWQSPVAVVLLTALVALARRRVV